MILMLLLVWDCGLCCCETKHLNNVRIFTTEEFFLNNTFKKKKTMKPPIMLIPKVVQIY